MQKENCWAFTWRRLLFVAIAATVPLVGVPVAGTVALQYIGGNQCSIPNSPTNDATPTGDACEALRQAEKPGS